MSDLYSYFQIGWLVGLLEGDGSIGMGPARGGKHRYPIISLKMTDRDVVEKFARVFDVRMLGPYLYPKSQLGKKVTYVARVSGQRAEDFLLTAAPYFSDRRRKQIERTTDKDEAFWRAL